MYYGHWAIEGSDACGHVVRVFYPIRPDGGPCETPEIRERMEREISRLLSIPTSADVAYSDITFAEETL